jgi:hypothetical protein
MQRRFIIKKKTKRTGSYDQIHHIIGVPQQPTHEESEQRGAATHQERGLA